MKETFVLDVTKLPFGDYFKVYVVTDENQNEELSFLYRREAVEYAKKFEGYTVIQKFIWIE